MQRLYVNNFRCFRNFELRLDGRGSVLLLGRNGSGKSGIGHALELLQRVARGVSRVGDLVKPRDFFNGDSISPMRFEIRCKLGGNLYDYTLALELPPSWKELRVFEERLEVNQKTIFVRKHSEVRIHRPEKSDDIVLAVSWHVVALPIIQDRPPQDIISSFKYWLARSLILRPIPHLFSGTTDLDSDNLSQLDAHGEGLGSFFTDLITTSPQAYQGLDETLRQLMPEFSRVTNQIIGKSIRSILFHFQNSQGGSALDLDQLSEGEKIFFLFALVKAAAESEPNLLCFWDEPESHLAADEVGHAVLALRKAFSNGGKLVMTSHSPEAIRRFPEDAVFYLSRPSRLDPTRVKTVTDMRSDNDFTGSFTDAIIRGDLVGGEERAGQ